MRAAPVHEAPDCPRWLHDVLDGRESWLTRRPLHVGIALAVVLLGLEAAHEATSSFGLRLAAVGVVICVAVAASALLGRVARETRFTGALLRGLDESGEAVSITDARGGRVLWVNDASARMLGRPRGEIVGADAAELLCPEVREQVRERFRLRASGHDVPAHVESRIRRADGTSAEVSAVSIPLDADGNPVVLTISRDVSDRAAAVRAARADQAFTAAVLDTVGSAVAVLDQHGLVVLVNGTFERLAGRAAGEIVGTRWQDLGLLPPDATPAIHEAIGAVAAGEPRATLASPWVRADGRRLVVEWNVTGVREDGGLRYIVVAGSDATARSSAEARLKGALVQLESRTAELERLNGELEQFASIASHDLREPLRAISGFAELLRRDSAPTLSDRSAQFLEMIQSASVRMDALLDALSRYGRAGRGQPPTAPVDVREALDHVLESLSVELSERRARVTHDPLPVVVGDPVAVEQVLQNLIANALKFNEAEVPEVHVAAQPATLGWELTVRDNGIGIPEKERERVFEIFRRLHPREAYPGTGAGLAIVQRIVQRHGGRVWVDDAPGGGSEFHVVLPGPEVAA